MTRSFIAVLYLMIHSKTTCALPLPYPPSVLLLSYFFITRKKIFFDHVKLWSRESFQSNISTVEILGWTRQRQDRSIKEAAPNVSDTWPQSYGTWMIGQEEKKRIRRSQICLHALTTPPSAHARAGDYLADNKHLCACVRWRGLAWPWRAAIFGVKPCHILQSWIPVHD